jgi:hypothetical protein
MYDIPDGCEPYLYKTFFTDKDGLSQIEMNGVVNFMSVAKHICGHEGKIPKVFVHMLDTDNMRRLVQYFHI